MKKSFFKTAAVILMAAMMLLAVSCSKESEAKSTASDERVVTTVCRSSYANEEWYLEMNKAFEAETGIHVSVQPTPGNDADHDAKVNIDLLAGGNIDVIPSFGPKHFIDRQEAGYFLPLSEALASRGVDADEIWGRYLQKDENGDFYGLPVKQEVYCVFYNRDLFDRAGVPYPEGNWTWDEYVEIAEKLTDAEAGIYGSYMNMANPWFIFPAKQLEVPAYREDGKTNLADPAFREAIEWYASLGNELGVQMPVEEMVNENVSWNYWAIAGDHLAMYPQGNWFMRLLNSPEDYPRDWKYGVAPMPSAGKDGENTFVSMGYQSVNRNAEHKDEAIEYVIWLGENQWKYENGIPAHAELTAEEQNQVFSKMAELSNGQVTVEELYRALVDTGLGVVYTDLVGTAAAEINVMMNSEVQAYCLGTQSIETTMKNIASKANESIVNAQ